MKETVDDTKVAQHDQLEVASPTVEPAGVGAVNALLKSGIRDAARYGELLRSQPANRDAIITMLHKSLGSGFVSEILRAGVSETPLGTVRATAEHGLRIRATPEQHGENVIGMLKSNETAQAKGRAGDWLEIGHGGGVGFVHGDFVQPVDDAPVERAPVAPTQPVRAPEEIKPPHQPILPPVATRTAVPATPTTAPVVEPGQAAHIGDGHAPETANTTTAVSTTAAVTPGKFRTLAGNEVDATTVEEAHVLNALRGNPKRFDAAWLIRVQRDVLKVGDATGAMNTETLRALVKRGATLDATSILDAKFLQSLDPANPFMPDGPGVQKQRANPRATSAGDRAAQAVGYADYRTYRADFDKDVKFLSVGLAQGKSDGTCHPYLTARLQAAERFLETRFPGKTHPQIQQEIKWSGKGGLAYDDQEGTVETQGDSHQHTMGLAIDIDVAQNPWVFATDGTDNMQWWKTWYETTFEKAAKVFGGEKLSAKKMFEMSMTSSTEELHAKILQTSEAFRQYIGLSKQLNQGGDHHAHEEAVITTLMTNGHYSRDEARAELKDLMKVDVIFHGTNPALAFGRHDAASITNHSLDLVVALRDAGGLAWGGTEMHVVQNGDFMHFDCRHDMNFGQATFDKTPVPDLVDHEQQWDPKKK